MTFDEAMQVWAKKQFDLYHYPYSPEDLFDVESTVIYGGGCETCSYETAGYRIFNKGTRKLLEIEVSFSELMRELQAITEAAT